MPALEMAPSTVTDRNGTDSMMGPKPKKSPLEDYFANAPRPEVADKLLKLVEDYYEFLRMSGRLYILQRAWEYYFQGQVRQARLRKAGKENEYTIMGVNHYRNILRNTIIRTVSQAVVYDPMAANTDHKSQAQTITAVNILDYYNREKGMEDLTDKAVELAVSLTEAYVSAEWDAQAGDAYMKDPQTGEDINLGDIDFNVYGPFDIVYDHTQRDPEKRDWLITVTWVNKYDYAARYPELAERIVKVSADVSTWKKRNAGMFEFRETDSIPRYRFYHRKTPAVPDGRFIEFFSSDLVTLEGPLNYDRIPVYRLAPEELLGTPFGYSIALDLLPLQEAIDSLYSTIITNQASFGVQNILSPTGAGGGRAFDVEEIVAGLNLIPYDPKFGKPEVLELLSTAPEIFKFLDMLIEAMQTIAGISALLRGNPDPSVKSGAYAALIASQSIEFNSGLQKSYAHLQRDLATGVIEILKQNADKPRLITIAGKANRSYIKEFQKDDLSSVTRVTVNLGNPLSRTTAGKLQLADTLIDKGLIKTPEEYLQLATTGRLEPLYEGEQSQLMLIRGENEKLSDENEKIEQTIDPLTGQPMPKSSVPALWTDNHPLHIKEHLSTLASPESRNNPVIVQNTLTHCQEHLTLWRQADPTILAVLGIPALAPAMPPPSPEGAPSSAPNGGGGGNGGAEVMDPRDAVSKKAEEVNQPNMPQNPMSGQPFNNQTGGI